YGACQLFEPARARSPDPSIMLFLPILHDGEGFELEDPKPRSSDPGRGGCRTELPPGRRVAKRASRGLRLTALAALAIGFTGVSGTASMPVREHCGPMDIGTLGVDAFPTDCDTARPHGTA